MCSRARGSGCSTGRRKGGFRRSWTIGLNPAVSSATPVKRSTGLPHMKFDHHAFISYAHIDNEPLTPGQKGWVAQFHATLQTMLSQRLGEKARIWRDDKLEGNDMFAQEIVDQFARTALLISILSPRYVRSEWCTRELRAFCEAAALTGGVTIGNKSRIFKVVKTPADAG